MMVKRKDGHPTLEQVLSAALWYIDGEEKWLATIQNRHKRKIALNDIQGMIWLIGKIRKHYGCINGYVEVGDPIWERLKK